MQERAKGKVRGRAASIQFFTLDQVCFQFSNAKLKLNPNRRLKFCVLGFNF